MSSYYVVYDIPKINCRNKKSGPYTPDEIQSQANDIRGFLDVTNVRVMSADLISSLADESDEIVNDAAFTD
jgi:homoserine trans-succinylase